VKKARRVEVRACKKGVKKGNEWRLVAHYLIGDGALNGAGVVAAVDLLEGGEVDVAVVGDHDASVLLDEVGKVVASPVEFHVWNIGRILSWWVLEKKATRKEEERKGVKR
jgi:hypothetical protein